MGIFKLFKNKENRLVEASEIKDHPWFGFANNDWNLLAQKKIPVPWVPRPGDLTSQKSKPKWNAHYDRWISPRVKNQLNPAIPARPAANQRSNRGNGNQRQKSTAISVNSN